MFFQGMDARGFAESFKTEDDCRQYLHNIKWQNGFRCRRCSHDKFWSGRTPFHARCGRCNYDESVTAHTVFHNIQFSLLKAFDITFHLVVLLKGSASRNLAGVVGVNPKTAFKFMHKVRKSMGAWVAAHVQIEESTFGCTVDSVIITHRLPNLNGLQKLNITINKSAASAKKRYIHFKGRMPDQDALDPCRLLAGKYVEDGKSILAWNLRSWLTGVHHHLSEKYRQNYLDEYSYKFCFRNDKSIIWHALTEWMAVGKNG